MNISSRSLLSLSLALALVSCGGSSDATAPAAGTAAGTAASVAAPAVAAGANQVAAQIADTLQACSYDGKPVSFGLGGAAPQNCVDMIAQVMNFTGLPQNFTVGEADVPNAAAAILLDQDKLPHRVIAFNPQFIEQVRQATGTPWAAVSVMAHEAGHHLAGHTIQPGGSQPPIELEADKFSGFVLYKMGASRADALKAIQMLVPAEVPAGASHPPRDRRVSAVSEGWDQACQQTGRGDCASGGPGSAPPAGIVTQVAQSPVKADPVVPGATVPQPQPAQSASSNADGGFDKGATTLPAVVVMPTPDPKALPTKGTQFIYDETGLLDKAEVARQEKVFYDYAKSNGVEIVTIFAKHLKGMTPEQYAWAMMRQLRVGKLDVGNGVVIVWHPDGRQGGVAMGPGVRNEMAFHIDGFPQSAKRMLESTWEYCIEHNSCGVHTENYFLFADNIRRDTRHWEWTIRYPSLSAIQNVSAAENEAQRNSDERYDPKKSQVWRKIVRLSGTVVAVDPGSTPKSRTVWKGLKTSDPV